MKRLNTHERMPGRKKAQKERAFDPIHYTSEAFVTSIEHLPNHERIVEVLGTRGIKNRIKRRKNVKRLSNRRKARKTHPRNQ